MINNKWFSKFISLVKEYFTDCSHKPAYEILDIYECNITGFTKAQIKLGGRHIIEKNINEIVTDMYLLEGFDKKAIRTLTYLATVERLKPDYSIVVQQLGNEVDEYILEIRSKYGKEITKKTPSEVSKDKLMLLKFGPLDANKIGYLAGVKETVRDFNLKKLKIENK